LPSRKKQEDPWWFSPTIFDIMATAKVLQKFNSAMLQKIFHAMTRLMYPNRPRRAKSSWTEAVDVDGATFQLSCYIDENAKKIVVTYIKPPKKMMRSRRHK